MHTLRINRSVNTSIEAHQYKYTKTRKNITFKLHVDTLVVMIIIIINLVFKFDGLSNCII